MNYSSSVDINGEKIRLLREEHGLTQLYLATVVGVTTDTISRWENRRYPSIKLENAKKLAEALEVPFEELLDDKSSASSGDENTADKVDAFPTKKSSVGQRFLSFFSSRKRWLGLAGGLVFCGILVLSVLFIADRPGVKAVRILPHHTAPSLPFPVIIQTVGKTDARTTLLIREELAGECDATGSTANGAVKKFGKNPRWIGALLNGRATFLYLVHPGKKLRAEDALQFSGDVIAKEGQTVGTQIGGANSIVIAPYHWVDTDRDYVISDSEILKAYETYALPGENLVNFTIIEELWLAGKYTWDKKALSFVPSYAAESKE
jgi:transcriptional regulator with XRE-family HTH domain